MQWRSLEFRLAAWSSGLLFAGLLSLGAALWWGVNHSMVAAADELLVRRADHLKAFVETEFGAHLPREETDETVEFTGIVERLDVSGGVLEIAGAEIHLDERTVFVSDTGKFDPKSLEVGQSVEIEMARRDGRWVASSVSLEPELAELLREELREYAMAVPEGNLIHIRDSEGNRVLPIGAASPGPVILPWLSPPSEGARFETHESASGAYRVLSERANLAGRPYELMLASSLRAVSVTNERLRQWLLWALLIGLLISFAGGYSVSRSALRPVEDMARRTSKINVGSLSQRLVVPANGGALEQLAETMNGMLSKLESSVRRLDEFTADASHEMRTPVSVIRTTAELALRQKRPEKDLRRDVAEIHDQAVQLTRLIDDLLTLARADGGSDALAMAKVGLGLLAAAVCEQMAARAAENSVDLRVETQAGSLTVDGHNLSLRRLLVILLDNALDHTPPDGTVVTLVTREGTNVQVSVEDSGQGIPEEELERVFERFHRVDPSRARESGRFGLGLAIAKWIVESHGGSIRAANQVGKGSVFTVSLPAPEGPPPSSAVSTKRREP